jgi:AcrR family transcriptional regulator
LTCSAHRNVVFLTNFGTTARFLAVQPGPEQGGQERRSFIEAARRAQIVDSAIEVIAEVGYTKTSMARIAERAGVSRGLISYHFAGKDEVIAQVLITVFGDVAAFMGPRVEAESTAAGQLRAYLQSNLDYMNTHRSRIVALVEIVSSGVLNELGVDPIQAENEALAPLVDLFRRGQADGEFRMFDPQVMARAVRGVIDSMSPHVADPGFDLNLCAREVTTMFELATSNADGPAGASGTRRHEAGRTTTPP